MRSRQYTGGVTTGGRSKAQRGRAPRDSEQAGKGRAAFGGRVSVEGGDGIDADLRGRSPANDSCGADLRGRSGANDSCGAELRGGRGRTIRAARSFGGGPGRSIRAARTFAGGPGRSIRTPRTFRGGPGGERGKNKKHRGGPRGGAGLVRGAPGHIARTLPTIGDALSDTWKRRRSP
jgi:hypothetical protein